MTPAWSPLGEGTSVFYRRAYPQILQACDIVHQVLRAQLADTAAPACQVPLGQIGAAEQELPRDREILLIGRSGQRSAQATHLLVKAGHSAVNVAGGMQAWTQAGLPVDR